MRLALLIAEFIQTGCEFNQAKTKEAKKVIGIKLFLQFADLALHIMQLHLHFGGK